MIGLNRENLKYQPGDCAKLKMEEDLARPTYRRQPCMTIIGFSLSVFSKGDLHICIQKGDGPSLSITEFSLKGQALYRGRRKELRRKCPLGRVFISDSLLFLYSLLCVALSRRTVQEKEASAL